MSYRLHFEKLGRGHKDVVIDIEDFTEEEMSKCQNYLFSRHWDWVADLNVMKGCIDFGINRFIFTIEEIKD